MIKVAVICALTRRCCLKKGLGLRDGRSFNMKMEQLFDYLIILIMKKNSLS